LDTLLDTKLTIHSSTSSLTSSFIICISFSYVAGPCGQAGSVVYPKEYKDQRESAAGWQKEIPLWTDEHLGDFFKLALIEDPMGSDVENGVDVGGK
jgi:hypothetical protein